IGRLAHNPELRMFAEQFTQPCTGQRVIIGDQNTQRLRRATRGVMNQPFLPTRVILWCFCAVGGETQQTSPRESQCESGALRWGDRDVQTTAKQCKALLNAEQSQPGLCLVLVMESGDRIKTDAVIAHLYMNGVTRTKFEVDIDPVNMGVLDCVEEQ